MMKVHKKIIFHTNHNFLIFDRSYVGKINFDNSKLTKNDFRARAVRELDESVNLIEDFYSNTDSSSPSQVGLKSSETSFFTIDGKIDYDYTKQERRDQLLKQEEKPKGEYS